MTTDQGNVFYFPILTVGEAAKYLGVGRTVVYRLIEHGQIRVVRELRTLLVEKKSLDEFMAGGH